jgi:hypothetical protein
MEIVFTLITYFYFSFLFNLIYNNIDNNNQYQYGDSL